MAWAIELAWKYKSATDREEIAVPLVVAVGQ